MSSMLNSFNGLVSSLLLNVGLTRLAEMVDPMLRDNRAIAIMLDSRSAAFCEAVCHFESAAFCEAVCHFESAAFCEAVCHFESQAS